MTSIRNLSHVSKVVAMAAIVSAPHMAAADTLMVITEFGAPKSERSAAVRSQLEGAGHKVTIAGSSLEDTALLLGCEAIEDDCLDSVIATAVVDGLVVVPSEAGAIRVRHGEKNSEFAIAADGGFDAAVAALISALAPESTSADANSVSVDPNSSTPPDTSDGVELPVDTVQGSPSAVGATIDPAPEPLASGAVVSSQDGSSVGRVSNRTWIVLGSGVVATGLGLGLLGVASSKQDEVDNHPADSVADLEALKSLEDSGARYTTMGNVFAVAGGVAVLAGIGLVIWDAKRNTNSGQAVLTPTANANGVGIALHWSTP